jgi:hypothetical protein
MRLATRGLRCLVLSGLALLCSTGVGGVAAASARVPFTDPSAVGYIGLCNEAGHQVTGGNLDTTPFAWRAVSSEPARAPYNNSWRTAILLAYQPRPGLAAGEWSGDELTSTSRYSNPAHPMVAATGGDDSLEDFIQEFHPVWDGYLELRIYLGTRNAEAYSLQYPVLAIKVTGDTWQAVGGGPVNCHSGTAESLESIVLPKSKTALPSTTVVAAAPDSQASASSVPAAGSSGRLPIVAVFLPALALLAACAWFIVRRRRPTSHPSMAGTTRRS